MTDHRPDDSVERPFDQLRVEDAAVTPPAPFVAALRARIAAALHVAALPVVDIPQPERSITMSTTSAAATAAPAGAAVTPAIVPYICATPAGEAIAWYVSALGAVEVERYVGDDGRVGHAQLSFGGARVYLSDEYPDSDAVSPTTLGGTTATLHLTVPDVDDVFERAVAAGARGDRPPTDQPYGDRSATIVDPYGHRWMVSTPIAHPTVEEINRDMGGFTVIRNEAGEHTGPVEIGYVALSSPDTARAVAFYGALFGWVAEGGHAGPGYYHVANTELPVGFAPGDPASAPQLYYRVADLAAMTARVEELGGRVVERSESASGAGADCVDDQGEHFQLWQPAPGY
jgi:uncharacterized glyoxalase superfamily protein PhnB